MRPTPNFGDPRLPERFWNKVSPEPNSGCWLWFGANTDAKGRDSYGAYGQIRVNKRCLVAHRFAYEALVSAIPAGLQLDHLCRVRCCVNPAHLEPVTNRENSIRGIRPQQTREQAAERTHCSHGHEYTPENTRIKPHRKGAFRSCRTCEQRLKQEAKERRGAR